MEHFAVSSSSLRLFPSLRTGNNDYSRIVDILKEIVLLPIFFLSSTPCLYSKKPNEKTPRVDLTVFHTR